MTFEKLAAQRRSVRKFTGRKVEKDVVKKILGITMTAPSSKNSKSTRIAVTEDKEILARIADMRSTGAGFVKDAPVVFFILGDDSVTDLWKENCAISATVLQYAAESLDLGTCWVHVNGRPHRDDDPEGMTAAEYLHEHIPGLEGYRILCVIAAGYPEMRHKPHEIAVDPDRIFYL